MTCCAALGLAPAALTLTATSADAQQFSDALYDGAKARVNRSASLRSLSEAVASASCQIGANFNVDAAESHLATYQDDFTRILDGLENGSAILGMPGEERRMRTLNTIQQTSASWAPMDVAAENLLNGGNSADAQTIRQSYADLFEQTVQLAAVISGQYADPQQLLQSDATVLNFAVRQRALGYRMARATCELASGTSGGETLEELATTVDLFERSLIALRDGFPAVGINPPPNEAVANSLAATYELWVANRGMFDSALAGVVPTEADVIAATDLSQELSVAMNNTITLYLIATPGQDGVYRIPLEAYSREELTGWLDNPALIEAIKAQNVRHADLTEDEIIALDQQWRAEAGEGGGPLISQLLEGPVSNWLLTQQIETAGFVTEVFVMDNKGLNVAQSVETSDYWQGDESKWQQTYPVGPDALHISEVEFDDSTGFYQSQASLSIKDPETGETIGAVTFGINVQNLM
ncbi:type IV pili methyl-accepting chemotaxis transducer N-terminal domain-containing protein [Loktanella sp. Alg231-35]|uniref:type IV pili methyl-accepting chemotaxis transducer N-terminal domain-containing protein n=1 Tax=Loktanella sp. Alg231-35 TaxID=1922220 RepID=UPI00131F142F|nr:type IV pili methyl-accepting chemotaxis transducer N-terminal domain-containing protein [Loktanella sp. Alg231-35]